MPRAGYLTPSTFVDLMTNGRGTNTMGLSALRIIDRLALDMLGVERFEESESGPASCEWGKEYEWAAVQEYQEQYFCTVVAPEFQICREYPYIGGTGDGLVGNDGGIEVKCPYNSIEHFKNLISNKQLEQYIYQIQGYMLIYERNWWDFLSYDPRFPDRFKLHRHKVYRDEEIIASIVQRCKDAYEMALEKAESARRIIC